MNRQHFRRTKRWRMSRNLQKRRVNLYFLEQRVAKLESRQELAVLDSENTQDLLNSLERKVQGLIDENKRLKQAENLQKPLKPRSTFWAWLCTLLTSKGKP